MNVIPYKKGIQPSERSELLKKAYEDWRERCREYGELPTKANRNRAAIMNTAKDHKLPHPTFTQYINHMLNDY